MRNHVLAILAIAFFGLTACSSSQKIERPAEQYEDNRVPAPLSVVSIPVRVNVWELERSMNAQLTGTLYEDTDLRDGDNMMLRAVKSSDIRMRIDSQQIKYRVPLVLWIKYDAGLTMLEANGDIVLDFITTFQLKPNWQLETRTELINHEWTRQPKLRVGLVNLPIGTLMNVVLRSSRSYLSKNIDNLVRKNLDLKFLINGVWQEMFQPIQLSEEYNAWLTVNPQRLGMTSLRAENNMLSSTIVVESRPEIKLGQRPIGRVPIPLPELVTIPAAMNRDSFVLHLDTEIPYEEAERLAAQQLIGETFSSGKRSVTVQGIDIYGSGKKLVVNTTLTGSYNGSVYLEGEPFFNSRKNTVEIRNLNFTLSTSNVLYKSAGWLLKSTIKRRIEENMQFLLDYNLTDTKDQLQRQIRSFSFRDGVVLNGQLQELNIQNVYLTPQAIVVDVALTGKVNLLVKGLN